MILSKSKIKLINSLKIKKYRKIENLFFCEGAKILETLLESHFKIAEIFVTKKFLERNKNQTKFPYTEITDDEMKKISALTTPQDVLALVKIPFIEFKNQYLYDSPILALDFIQDPGNLGTIIRIADWFGIKNIVCSTDTADIYNPKSVQATMGSLFSINVFYLDFDIFLPNSKEIPIYGTMLEGENIYKTELSKNGIILLGNEANGIRKKNQVHITRPITIPDFNSQKKAESLNVAISAAIVCSEFKRRQ